MNEWFLQRHLDLEWTTACLHGNDEAEAAQVLTLNIKAIDGNPIDPPSGFTVSYKQHTSPPSLLRLESTPNPSATDKDVAESWREPPQALRLALSEKPAEPVSEAPDFESLEDQIRQLKDLESELEALKSLVAEKKAHIRLQFRLLLKNEVHKVAQELGKCHSISCVFKTIVQKVHGVWEVAYIRLKSDQGAEEMGNPEHEFAQAHTHVAQATTRVSENHLSDTPSAPQPYVAVAAELASRPTKESPFVVALEITLTILCCGCLFAAIRHKCSSLRTRTERAAAREERNNARAYRRAARHHAWSTWWRNRWRGNWAQRDSQRIFDYEEKRALICEQESILEDAMQEEIRQLRAAHDVVNDLVRDAEEGRAINHARTRAPSSPLSTTSTYPPTSLPEIPSRPLSRTESLPSYRSDTPTEPPGYDSDRDMSEVVANGFRQYAAASTTSEASSHWTPDSSVVDVSPRPSAETLRYPVSILTLDEQESDVD
ncbi:uncharacterized protein SETTUDRAFT_168884 [Exserohilum turcica Et28A]|uniref:Uncharacterized protein n=1 Tax=Exserohilum turcicum (strain 28A) TaxID=671987 RepID=R0KEI7_EXST2|nr:uncharacterized protein SETTUDRAFT_168884 [Exserohilum turcica Et28A]EOA87734.1 hypothetical protein SETTUDRAFT_168884 [Exserohilum turcica Et28A]